ncbi:hypothetical protein N7489_008284 [Penicillium chrysogenum]|uniref:uncharacterized protein n=1 Tax=Penicillium chrysogenum TaxID=5076 RepID=UPI0024DF2037|nr:uncharacterized protein N7489_008284 [Penicillium chrysogenum]KAJ5238193.1 hypothetical protein N7489_008284 [Penicillium chrysogenum]
MAEISTKRSPQSNGQLLPNQKMRTTCNACQQAKIRCSHTYPCDRCESHGPAGQEEDKPAGISGGRREDAQGGKRSCGEGTEANPRSEGAESAQGPESDPESNYSIRIGSWDKGRVAQERLQGRH